MRVPATFIPPGEPGPRRTPGSWFAIALGFARKFAGRRDRSLAPERWEWHRRRFVFRVNLPFVLAAFTEIQKGAADVVPECRALRTAERTTNYPCGKDVSCHSDICASRRQPSPAGWQEFRRLGDSYGRPNHRQSKAHTGALFEQMRRARRTFTTVHSSSLRLLPESVNVRPPHARGPPGNSSRERGNSSA
jgi:hypothetical protein